MHFSVFRPLPAQGFPRVDLMFTLQGLEMLALDEVHNLFHEVVRSGTKYTLIGNTPGHENAKVVETISGAFTIARPDVPTLNVRAYPFGFGEALRVVPIGGRQLLLYESTEIRDLW